VSRRPLDPMAFPGIRSTNTVGLAEFSGAMVGESVRASAAQSAATMADVTAGRGVEAPYLDAYALALNVSRRLYDNGVAMQGSPALANLVARTTAFVNHFDLDRLGLKTGDVVQVTGPKGTLDMPVSMNDETPRGTFGVVFGSIDEDGSGLAASTLFDPATVITQVRLETR
jgi:anaerobic selenocysteine-containing dehydrogenase